MTLRYSLFSAALFLACHSTFGQSPNFDGFNYQAVVRDANGEPLPNQAVGVRVQIAEGVGDTYSETHSVVSDGNGLISFVMGEGTPFGGTIPTFDDIPWNSGSLYHYDIFVDLAGGTSYSYLGSGVFKAVPFALRALSSDNTGWIQTGDVLRNTNTGHVGIGTASPATQLEVGSADEYNAVGTFRNTNPLGRSSLQFFSNDGMYPILEVGYGNPGSNFMPGAAYLSATDTLHFITQGARRMTVDPFGQVGLGKQPEPFTMLSISDGNSTISLLDGGDGDLAWDGGADGEATFRHNGAGSGGTRFEASGGTSLMLRNNGNVGVGMDDPQVRLDVAGTAHIADPGNTDAPAPSAALEVSSTTGAILLPRMTTAQRDALTGAPGMMIYNTDDRKFQGYYSDEHFTLVATGPAAGSFELRNTTVPDLNREFLTQTFTVKETTTLDTLHFWVTSIVGGSSVDVTVTVGNTFGCGATSGPASETITVTQPGMQTVAFATPPLLEAIADPENPLLSVRSLTFSTPANPSAYLELEQGANPNIQMLTLWRDYAVSGSGGSGVGCDINNSSLRFDIRSTVTGSRWVDLH